MNRQRLDSPLVYVGAHNVMLCQKIPAFAYKRIPPRIERALKFRLCVLAYLRNERREERFDIRRRRILTSKELNNRIHSNIQSIKRQ